MGGTQRADRAAFCQCCLLPQRISWVRKTESWKETTKGTAARLSAQASPSLDPLVSGVFVDVFVARVPKSFAETVTRTEALSV